MKSRLLLYSGFLALACHLTAPGPAAARGCVIITATDPSRVESLAAREVRRYVYLRTGHLLKIVEQERIFPSQTRAIVIGNKAHARMVVATFDPLFTASVSSLEPQQYQLKTAQRRSSQTLLVVGGDDAGTLYAAYRLAEHLGVRFYLHGDVIPDERVPFTIPALDEKGAPLFALRGIQPFHDFPEGPDWWNTDDYLAILAQLPKLRMNFFGLHTYPEGGPNAEPTVWIGQPGDIADGGKVKFSYPSSYQNTLRGNWGYQRKKTSDFLFGGAQLFERDDFGAEVMWGHIPNPTTPEGNNEVFERTATMLRDAFSFARQLGIKTCVGTETPLVIPKLVQERMKVAGKKPADPATAQELYEGIFRRAAQAYPLDYYWLWTPEDWTWKPVSEKHIVTTTNDLLAAFAAFKNVSPPFKLATCGWVLGPPQSPTLFDTMLPKEIAVSCINRRVGNTPVDAGFADVAGRGKWAIPWMEDDPGLTEPQLWVGRMRRDAADALRYGCDGLLGIHWRTRVLAPNVAALAQAAWNQQPWLASYQPPPPVDLKRRVFGPIGGEVAHFPTHSIAGTEDAPLYQAVRCGLLGYRIPASNGVCTVTLKFCEPEYKATDLRVFDVKLQSEIVLSRFDIFARAGQNRALDFTFTNVVVENGWLDIDFARRVDFPCVAAIVVEGQDFIRNINCGGGVYKDFIADPAGVAAPSEVYAGTKDFYEDWAAHEFGENMASASAAIFQKQDCVLPRPSTWIGGPGGIQPDGRPWEHARKDYAFVDEFEALRVRVRGPGNLERFDYWLNTFRYLRAMGEVNCAWGEFNRTLQEVRAESGREAKAKLARELALPAREKLMQCVATLYDHLLATVTNPGEMGTVANWEQHNFPEMLDKADRALAKLLPAEQAPSAQPRKTYQGPTRIIVPTMRTSLRAGEPLKLKVIILSEKPVSSAALHWRELGKGRFKSVPLQHVARGVYSVELLSKAMRNADLEYYVGVKTGGDVSVRFPATAPAMNQTVVVSALD